MTNKLEMRQCFFCRRWFPKEHIETVDTNPFPGSSNRGCYICTKCETMAHKGLEVKKEERNDRTAKKP